MSHGAVLGGNQEWGQVSTASACSASATLRRSESPCQWGQPTPPGSWHPPEAFVGAAPSEEGDVYMLGGVFKLFEIVTGELRLPVPVSTLSRSQANPLLLRLGSRCVSESTST